jgi:hypothetical protein
MYKLLISAIIFTHNRAAEYAALAASGVGTLAAVASNHDSADSCRHSAPWRSLR